MIRSDSTVTDLLYTIQILMGWNDYHLNKLSIHAKSYGVYHMGGMYFPDNPDGVLLSDFEFRHKERFLYEYDFNIDWMINIRLEERRALDPNLSYPTCISGSRAGPPEECGGPIAFMAWEDEFSPSLVVSRIQDLCEDHVDEIEL
ncbi:MAG: plasmid pRiA4b ORF-3 family protein [Halioglobus sp.]